MLNIGVLISGGGTNLQAIIDETKSGGINGTVKLVISNKENAYGLERARLSKIKAVYETDEDKIIGLLKENNIDLVVLAGYLKIIHETNILNTVTRIDKRNLHIGSKMLEYIISTSKNEKANSITLEVNVNNIPAIKLYEKYNFEKVGLRKRYYYDTDDAIIMTLHI